MKTPEQWLSSFNWHYSSYALNKDDLLVVIQAIQKDAVESTEKIIARQLVDSAASSLPKPPHENT